jgi:ABC-type multidrug transport system ATPase subunit
MINAIMLGLTRRQARDRFDEIIAFAELEEFLDLKLKNYSSGMSVRLAFSVAVQVDADILLVDEVLAVGDAAFQQKCFDQFHRLKDEGRTIVFVTHDMSAVERFCDRAMLLERGRVLSIDAPSAISRAYTELCFGGLEFGTPDGARGGSHKAAEIRDAWFENESGERVTTVAQSEGVHLCMEVAFHLDVAAPVYAFTLRNEVRHTVFATSSATHPDVREPRTAGDVVVARVAMANWLAPARYDLTPAVVGAAGRGLLDQREDLKSLLVHGTRHSGGAVDIPHSFEVGPA